MTLAGGAFWRPVQGFGRDNRFRTSHEKARPAGGLVSGSVLETQTGLTIATCSIIEPRACRVRGRCARMQRMELIFGVALPTRRPK
jgi:hypothetical protein